MSEYEQGYRDGANDAANLKRIEHRISAFGAIRRAAKVARDMDDIANVGQRKGKWVEAGHWNFRADAIRHAIRAAIGSPKA